MEFHSFPSIGQFREAVKYARKFMYKDGQEQLTIPYTGTVKLHGTNAGIIIEGDQIGFQSRSRILEINSDNVGFCFWGEQNKDFFFSLRDEYFKGFERVILFGEWVGQGIQKDVGISQIEKSFFMFAVNIDGRWSSLPNAIAANPDIKFFPLTRPVYEITIPFHNPEKEAEQMEQWVAAVEAECPVAKQFGVFGIGEGIVFVPCDFDLRQKSQLWFKVKGEKHSVSKVNTGAKVPLPVVENLSEVLDSIVTENRLKQGIDFLKSDGKEITQALTGDYIRWVVNDIMKEEKDFFLENNIQPKQINSHIANRAREFFTNRAFE